jgi:hypothetical protein
MSSLGMRRTRGKLVRLEHSSCICIPVEVHGLSLPTPDTQLTLRQSAPHACTSKLSHLPERLGLHITQVAKKGERTQSTHSIVEHGSRVKRLIGQGAGLDVGP